MSKQFGSHPYFDIGAFKDVYGRKNALNSFCELYERSKDGRAKHYTITYDTPVLPPIWVMKEFLTFGAMSYILKNLSGTVRNAVSLEFGVRSDAVFLNWIACLVDLRNICAHHDRLFNRTFQKQPTIQRSPTVPTAPNNKLKAVLECLDHMTARRGLPANVVAKVSSILGRYPEITPSEAGF
jgi:abortive infection bacteriophage resistance protein